MGRRFFIALMIVVLCGCGKVARMEHPEDPQGRYHEQIAAATQLLQQKEDWADRAEWEVAKTGDHWLVTAWRVEHPDKQGADRYLPWGYSVIELDSRFVAVNYHRKG
jgi:uncharacterized protein YceK